MTESLLLTAVFTMLVGVFLGCGASLVDNKKYQVLLATVSTLLLIVAFVFFLGTFWWDTLEMRGHL